MKKMYTLKAGLITSSLLLSATAYAAPWVNDDNVLEAGTTIQAISANSNKNSYTSNSALTNRAWGMTGAWLNFEVQQATDVMVSASSAMTNAPGFTIYRADGVFIASPGAQGKNDKDGTEGAIHAFNQVGQPGKPGLVWATDNDVVDSLEGNTVENGLVQTLGYVNGSSTDFINLWEDNVLSGAHDVSIDNKYESGVYGSVQHHSGPNGHTNYSNLTLVNLQPGHYTLFVGGTNSDGEDTPIDVKVSALAVSVADCVLNYQEQQEPTNYPTAGLTSQTLVTSTEATEDTEAVSTTYYYRYYAETGSYLGIAKEDNYLYSLNQNGELNQVGDAADLAAAADCK